jgi:ubiquinone biosynthesis protein
MGDEGADRDADSRSGSDGLPDEEWLTSIGLHALLPASLVRWRPLVEAAALFFLGRLPPQRLAAIMLGQLALGPDAPPAQRLVAVLAQCPTLHKLGQVLARQPRLDPALCRQLQSLESMPATTPLGPVLARIRDELGEDPAVRVADAALAEGSVAVVLPFAYRDGGRWRDGVFKVLRPGVEARLADELAILPDLAAFLERRGAELGLPPLDYRDSLTSVRRLLVWEIRLDVEQRNLRAAAAFYADEPRVWVPRVLPWCTPRVTAMERVFGTKLADARLAPPQRRELAQTAIRALLAKPFWTRAEPAVFHADLHGGNLFAADDGRLAVLDWSLTARMSKAERERLLGVATGGLAFDAAKIRAAVAALGSFAADDPLLADVVERALDRLVLRGGVAGFDWLVALLDELALSRPAGFGEDLALFRKTWLSLSGVIGDLAGAVAPDVPLLAAGLKVFVAELPARWVAPGASRGFATHLSNADLVALAASPPLASLRYWTRLGTLALRRVAAAYPPAAGGPPLGAQAARR